VKEGGAVLTAHPGHDDGLVLAYHLDYGRQTPIGSQSLFIEVSPETFREELAPSRTFLLESEAKALRQAGIGARTTEADLLIFGSEGVIGNELRYRDECVRHKILDMVGDLALLDRDLSGHVVAHRSGHQLNAALVRKLVETIEADQASRKAPACQLDIQQIMNILPHRYPFLLVDRILEHERARRVVGLKNVSCNEPFFQGHWPGRPIMPGVLIVEALAQTAGVMIADWVDTRTHVALIISIDQVKIRKAVIPGDQLRLEVTSVRNRSSSAHVQGIAMVDGQVAAEAKIRFVMVPAETAA
jgi:UDP-3-O-[3-hydroxymyristoyl] N-acetylglucosamine deacetylase/3-hydroxyacyl-[acyl-carrier-protein] dehydratase